MISSLCSVIILFLRDGYNMSRRFCKSCANRTRMLYRTYYIDVSVLLGIPPLVKFIRNYIRDRSDVFSLSSLVRLSVTSFPALQNSICVQSCQTNVDNVFVYIIKRKLHVSSKM